MIRREPKIYRQRSPITGDETFAISFDNEKHFAAWCQEMIDDALAKNGNSKALAVGKAVIDLFEQLKGAGK